jgi:small-conductance mechanosensitive channel
VNTANVLNSPLPKTTLKDIKPNALDFQVSCWVRDIAISSTVRNELLANIHKALREAGVVYPKISRTED